jgi:hypothetical protein
VSFVRFHCTSAAERRQDVLREQLFLFLEDNQPATLDESIKAELRCSNATDDKKSQLRSCQTSHSSHEILHLGKPENYCINYVPVGAKSIFAHRAEKFGSHK